MHILFKIKKWWLRLFYRIFGLLNSKKVKELSDYNDLEKFVSNTINGLHNYLLSDTIYKDDGKVNECFEVLHFDARRIDYRFFGWYLCLDYEIDAIKKCSYLRTHEVVRDRNSDSGTADKHIPRMDIVQYLPLQGGLFKFVERIPIKRPGIPVEIDNSVIKGDFNTRYTQRIYEIMGDKPFLAT